MNPQTRLDQLLEDSGAVAVRNNKHTVYRLPGGKMHTSSKTPSDWRSVLNNLTQLKRTIRTSTPAAPPVPPPALAPVRLRAPAPLPTPEPEPVPTIEAPVIFAPSTPFTDRLNDLIAAGETEQQDLMERAEAVSMQLDLLREIRKHAGAPHTEALLTLLLPERLVESAPAAAAPPPTPPPPPQQHATVTITRDLVRRAIRTLSPDEKFTVHKLYDLFVPATAAVEGEERLRIRRAIASALITIHQFGEEPILRLAPGGGRKLGIWQKTDPNQIGRRVEVYPEPQPAEEVNIDV